MKEERVDIAASELVFQSRVDQTFGVIDHVERLQTEEVELDETGGFDVAHRKLSDDLVVVSAENRDDVPQRAIGDHDTRGVHPRLAVEALELLRDPDDLFVDRLLFFELAQLRLELER